MPAREKHKLFSYNNCKNFYDHITTSMKSFALTATLANADIMYRGKILSIPKNERPCLSCQR
jgi:hypothetical protein